MKTDDISFKFLAAIVLAGVIVAVVNPARPLATAPSPVAQSSSHEQFDPGLDDSHLASETGISE